VEEKLRRGKSVRRWGRERKQGAGAPVKRKKGGIRSKVSVVDGVIAKRVTRVVEPRRIRRRKRGQGVGKGLTSRLGRLGGNPLQKEEIENWSNRSRGKAQGVLCPRIGKKKKVEKTLAKKFEN